MSAVIWCESRRCVSAPKRRRSIARGETPGFRRGPEAPEPRPPWMSGGRGRPASQAYAQAIDRRPSGLIPNSVPVHGLPRHVAIASSSPVSPSSVGVVLLAAAVPARSAPAPYAPAASTAPAAPWNRATGESALATRRVAAKRPASLPAWQDKLRILAGESRQAATDAALKEKQYEEALEHSLQAAMLLGTPEADARASVIDAMLAEVAPAVRGRPRRDRRRATAPGPRPRPAIALSRSAILAGAVFLPPRRDRAGPGGADVGL